MRTVLSLVALLAGSILVGCGSADKETEVGEVKVNADAAKLKAEGKLKTGGAMKPPLD